MRRIFAKQLRARGLAAQSLLQIVEGGYMAVDGDQQFPVQNCLEIHHGKKIRKGGANVLTIAAEQPALPVPCDQLRPDTIPLPLGDEVLKSQLWQLCLFERMRKHERAESRAVLHHRRIRATFEPGEKLEVRRPK